MPGNWLKINRSLLDWEWYKDSTTKSLFLHLLLRANWKAGRFMGQKIERGQFPTGRKSLAQETGIKETTIERHLKRLEESGEITQKADNKKRIITICNYDKYQEGTVEPEQQTDNKRTTNGQQTDTIEEGKEGKKVKKTKDIVFNPHSIRPEWIEEKDWSDIILHRKKHKNKPPETERAFNGIINQLEKATKQGFSLKECVDQMCSRGWQSFNVDWMPAKNGIMQPRTKKEVHDETRERFARELLEAGDTGYKPDYRRNEELDHKI